MKCGTRYLAALLGASLLAVGCSRPPATEAPPSVQPGGGAAPTAGGATSAKATIGVSLLTLANPFFKEMADAMEAEGAKHGFELTVTAGEMDPSKQKSQVDDFIVRKVAAIVLCPCDSRSIATSIQAANGAGIPVFTADIACLDPAVKVVSHIATDNYDGGKLAAQAMIEALGGKGKVAIIDHPEVESVIQRTKGFREVIEKTAPGIEIVAALPGGGQRDSAFRTAQDLLEKERDLAGIFAINDPSALGAVAAIEKAGKSGQIKVIGFDGQPEAKQAIKKGDIYADSIQFPDKIGALTIQTIARYLAGEQVEAQTLIPTALYRKADAEKDPSLQ
jgi:ribose transport system substrate-binding protein